MDSTVLIVLIVVIGVLVLVWMLKDRITLFSARGSVDKREGELKVEAAPPQVDAGKSGARPSVDISGNKALGNTRIDVKRGDVRVDDNLLTGKTDIQVEDDQKKPRR